MLLFTHRGSLVRWEAPAVCDDMTCHGWALCNRLCNVALSNALPRCPGAQVPRCGRKHLHGNAQVPFRPPRAVSYHDGSLPILKIHTHMTTSSPNCRPYVVAAPRSVCLGAFSVPCVQRHVHASQPIDASHCSTITRISHYSNEITVCVHMVRHGHGPGYRWHPYLHVAPQVVRQDTFLGTFCCSQSASGSSDCNLYRGSRDSLVPLNFPT